MTKVVYVQNDIIHVAVYTYMEIAYIPNKRRYNPSLPSLTGLVVTRLPKPLVTLNLYFSILPFPGFLTSYNISLLATLQLLLFTLTNQPRKIPCSYPQPPPYYSLLKPSPCIPHQHVSYQYAHPYVNYRFVRLKHRLGSRFVSNRLI